jgi:nitrogen fixation protein NifQ
MSATMTLGPLMYAASDPGNPITQALGGVLARFSLHGLDGSELNRLRAKHFPHAPALPCDKTGACVGMRGEEIDDVLQLLLDHRSDDGDETRWLAHAIATACLGGNHLYQDMGFNNRATLSELLRRHFTSLYEKNNGNMKWKKFFYKQLCARAEINICKAPSCQVCDDYAKCFGPEEA